MSWNFGWSWNQVVRNGAGVILAGKLGLNWSEKNVWS
jgi:hypothetical protein